MQADIPHEKMKLNELIEILNETKSHIKQIYYYKSDNEFVWFDKIGSYVINMHDENVFFEFSDARVAQNDYGRLCSYTFRDVLNFLEFNGFNYKSL